MFKSTKKLIVELLLRWMHFIGIKIGAIDVLASAVVRSLTKSLSRLSYHAIPRR